MSLRTAPLEDRFWAKVDKSGDCWIWTGSKSGNGYGNIAIGSPSKKLVSAHRLSYEIANGRVAQGMVIDHKCHNKACVNPVHLQAVPQKLNGENRRGPNSDNTSGIRGVSWNKGARKYEARVGHNGKVHYAGLYPTKAEAAAALIALRNSLHTNNPADRSAA